MALRAVPDHPKFAELKTILRLPKGAVLGWLEGIWHFTGRFTPRGNIGKYSDTAIEAWVEWDGQLGALIAALVQAGWVDKDSEFRLVVHDWHIHADNATKMAVKRSGKPFCLHSVETLLEHSGDTVPEISTPLGLPVPVPEPEPAPEPEPEVEATPAFRSVASPAFVDSWNELRGDLPRVSKLTKERQRHLASRARDGLTLESFRSAVSLCARTPFLLGENDRGWKASFDWLVANDSNLVKVIEGRYSSKSNSGGSSGAIRYVDPETIHSGPDYENRARGAA